MTEHNLRRTALAFLAELRRALEYVGRAHLNRAQQF